VSAPQHATVRYMYTGRRAMPTQQRLTATQHIACATAVSWGFAPGRASGASQAPLHAQLTADPSEVEAGLRVGAARLVVEEVCTCRAVLASAAACRYRVVAAEAEEASRSPVVVAVASVVAVPLAVAVEVSTYCLEGAVGGGEGDRLVAAAEELSFLA
jgi:hypothetical protein